MDSLTGYVETRIELMKLEIREEVAKVIANGLMILIVVFLAFIFLLFMSVGLAHYLNTYFNGAHIGYWIVGGIYGIPCLIFILFRKKISHHVETHLLEKIKRKKK
jgi:hypothetical protein